MYLNLSSAFENLGCTGQELERGEGASLPFAGYELIFSICLPAVAFSSDCKVSCDGKGDSSHLTLNS